MSDTPNNPGLISANTLDIPPKANGNGVEQPAQPAPAPAPAPGSGDKPASPSFRGPLRYEVETSSTQLEAGKSFSIFIKITNPYDLPVRIISAKTEVPVEFVDAEKHVTSLWQAIKDSSARAARRAELSAKRSYVVSAVNVSVKGATPTGEEEEEEPVMLQPGNSGLYEFKLCTSQAIFFTPSLYNMHMQIQYEMDGAVNHDTVKEQMNIRAPLKALISGSTVGAWVGTILAGLLTPGAHIVWLPTSAFMAKLIASVLLGSVIVVAFARKKDAQPFLSVEDFYGGFFIGFLAAWTGPSLLKNVLPVG
jgi:hypothetical protein